MKKIVLIGFIMFLFSISSVFATDKIALIVKDAHSLSFVHEEKVYQTLTEMGFDVDFIDKNSVVDYSNYTLIVVAGRPGNVKSYEHLDSFVADTPVNDYPTVAIDSVYPDDWDWIKPGGMSTLFSGSFQKITIVDDTHPITQNRTVGDVVTVHIVPDKTILDLVNDYSKLTPLATVGVSDHAVIAYGEPNTALFNNKTINTRVVFFGVTNPLYWSDEAEDLFKKSVEWVSSDMDEDGVLDYEDNCPLIPNINQKDSDDDGVGDVCDNCPSDNNPAQSDLDNDRVGDKCDQDLDGDDVLNDVDNCPDDYNPNQEDSDGDDIGDVCEILPYQVFLDVDDDDLNETAINENNITEDGFEVYEDSDSSSKALAMDGDYDGMIDWLIDISPFGRYERYWDPDDGILTDVERIGSEYYIDVDGDGESDIIFNSFYDALVVKADVDSDSKLEMALDEDMDRSYDDYKDTDRSSKLLDIIDGDEDGKNDFIIGFDRWKINKPTKYWDPDDKILTNITEADVDHDGDLEYVVDVNGDEIYDKILNEQNLYDLPDLIVNKISINPSSPTPGSDVNITATVENIGGYDAVDFIVEFILDDTSRENKTISLTKNSSADVIFEWNKTTEGSYTIRIIADSSNLIIESNERNNDRSEDVSVSYPGKPYYGEGPFVPRGTANFTGFPEKVEMFVGDNLTLSGKFENNLNYRLRDVELNLTVNGMNPEWFSVTPTKFDRIEENEFGNVTIDFKIPPDAKIYTYSVILEANTDSRVGRQRFIEEFGLILLERIKVLMTTTSTTTTTVPTTTTIPEEGKPEVSPLTGLFVLVTSYGWVVVIIIVIILIAWKVLKVLGIIGSKGEYVYGKSWRIFTRKFKSFSIKRLKDLLTKW